MMMQSEEQSSSHDQYATIAWRSGGRQCRHCCVCRTGLAYANTLPTDLRIRYWL